MLRRQNSSDATAEAAGEHRDQDVNRPVDCRVVAGIFGLMGGFFWAIRGTSGFGGSNGGLFAGLGWGILWYFFSHFGGGAARRPLATPWMIAAITFGIAFGGMTGYGVYTWWVQGNYYLDHPDGLRAIAPWTGFAMLFLCGLHWGGVTGAFMAWCNPSAALRWWVWIPRIAAGFLGAWAALWFVNAFPQLLLPFYDEGLYQVREYRTSIRALGSIRNIAPHLGFFFGFLLFETARRNWRAVGMMLVMGLGFAIPFTIGGYWHTFSGSALQIDWWKNWEMSIGLGGGLAFGLAFYLFNRPEGGEAPGRYGVKSYILGAGFPIWLATTLSVRNGFRGFTNIHGIEGVQSYLMWVSIIALIPAILLFALWAGRIHNAGKRSLTVTVIMLVYLAAIAILVYRIPMFGLIPSSVYRFSLIYLIPGTLVVGYLLYRPNRRLEHSPIPNWALATILTLLIAIGYVTSIHVPMQLRYYVLVILYTLYILGSLALFAAWVKGKGQLVVRQ